MWLLRQSGLRLSPKQIFFITLLGLSAVVHLLFLAVVFLTCFSDRPLIINTLQQPSAPVVLVPLFKQMPAMAPPAAITKLVSPISKKTTVISSQKPTPAKKAPAAAQSAKARLPAQTKEVKLEKTTTLITSPIPQKKVEKTAKPETAPKKVEESAKPSQIKPTPIQEPVIKTPENFVISQPNPEPIAMQSLNYVGREEFDRLRLIEEIKIGIAQQWQRPMGMSQDAQCHLKISLDKQGNKKISIDKSSGARTYDICAQQALMRYNFPQEVWNQEIVLIM